ncbi:hypothetical protein N7492_007964 [Penicillium capsulatum]|uniref:BRCT domain-containing protein n=1 Tax=Penicillium capsulatum TaxID=69766 RepID=A0A9W9HPX1_9EURO|nr:hypothetical protein N7492_007964 [Penicillium capsulatum]KAJ6105371.1 hypothetical protein N7512_008888 [Penicillium capsulatum]
MGSRLEENSKLVRKRIESHNFADETGEEYEASSFGGFGDYMRRKKIKLQNLDAEIRATAGDRVPIFRGVVAHVNGYTQPSLQDLHRLIVSHGGGFLQYLDGKTVATHIIASSLTPKKCEEFRRYRIVKPAWVTESIKAGHQLPWNDFRVVDEGQSQKVLKFSSGHLGSQTNGPRLGYKEQSNTSWYNSQFGAARAIDSHAKSTQNLVTPPNQNKATSTMSSQPSPSRPETTPGPVTGSKAFPRQGSGQRQMEESSFHATATGNREDPDELESPRKGESARIQVDPVLSNSAHKPLNMSGSQFILPSQSEPMSSQPVGDIRSKLLAQAKPQPTSRTPPRQIPESAATGLPPQSQLDSEALAALPEDIRKEILGHYNQPPIASTPPIPSPASVPTEGNSQADSPHSPTTRATKRAEAASPTNVITDALGSSREEGSTALVEEPDLTSHQLNNVDGLRDSIQEWYSTFEDDGPYRDDVEAMSIYLRRVISEEEDVNKAVSVVRWLMWLVCKNPTLEPDAEAVTWAEAVEMLQGAVQGGLETKGLPPADFK